MTSIMLSTVGIKSTSDATREVTLYVVFASTPLATSVVVATMFSAFACVESNGVQISTVATSSLIALE